MGTGILTGEVYERRTAELYAADAGVEDALWRIQSRDVSVCPGRRTQPPYDMGPVNGNKVTVTIQYNDGPYPYKITSRAIGGSNSSTTVEAYVYAEFMAGNLLDNAITSLGNVEIGSNSAVNGTVQYAEEIKGKTAGISSIKEVYQTWPNATALSTLYLGQVDPNDPGPNSIDLDGETKTVGPCYINPDKKGFVVDNKGKNNATLLLQGTVYVNGDVHFEQSGNKPYTVDLNGKTIFAVGSIDFPTDRVTVQGPGCIIAIHDINFQPSISSSSDFVFVLSIEGSVEFKPNGTFYGSLAGDVKVDLQPNCSLTWVSWQGLRLNFPVDEYAYSSDIVKMARISTWEVRQQ
jgi:hypothetical protein